MSKNYLLNDHLYTMLLGTLAIFALKYAMHLAITLLLCRKYIIHHFSRMSSFAGNLWLRSSFKAIKVICVIFLFNVCTTKIHENRYLRFSDVKSSWVDPINYKHKV